MNITDLSIRNQRAVWVVIGLLCLFGYGAVSNLPVPLLPEVSSPQITIYNNWRSAAPQEVEESIVLPQEEMLQFTSGIEV